MDISPTERFRKKNLKVSTSSRGEMPWKCHHLVAGQLPGDSPDLETSNLPNSVRSPRRLVACGSGGASCEGIGCGGEAKKSLVSWFEVCRSFLKLVQYHKNNIHSLNQYMLAWLSLSFQAESIRYPEMRPAGYAFWVPGNPGTWWLKGVQLQLQRYEQHGKPHWISGAYICIDHCMYI